MVYRLEELDPMTFEKLVIAVCREILGSGVKRFAKGPDGGRDAAFEGTAIDFPSKANPWRGTFVIQAKHTENPIASCSDHDFFKNKTSIVKKEVETLKTSEDAQAANYYLLFTNRKASGRADGTIERYIQAEGHFENVSLIARETFEDYLTRFPEIVRRFRLGQLVVEGHNLPQEMLGDLFVGREHDLKVLGERLENNTVALTQTVLGTGGIGKTRLALEYAWRSPRKYRFFVNAATPATLQTGIVNLAKLLNIPMAQDQQAVYDAVMQKLQSLPDWLLILDNVDDADAQEAVIELTPHLKKHGQILVTSRRQKWPRGLETHNLNQLSFEASIAYINRALGQDQSDPATEKLAEIMAGLPLALELATAYIENRRITVSRYLEQWESDMAKLAKFADTIRTQYPDSLLVAWQRSMQRVSPAAQELLRIFGDMAAAPIPRAMLEQEEEQLITFLEAQCETDDATDITEALIELADISLINLTPDDIVLHPLLHNVLELETTQAHLEIALNLVNAYAPGEPYDVRTWPIWDRLRPHVALLVEKADAANITEPTATLMNELAILLYAKSLYKEAEPLYRRNLAIGEASLGPDHPEVAIRLNNLALLLKTTNRIAEAEPLYCRALAIDEASYGPDHPNVARDLNNLAELLRATNRLAEAEPLYCRALAIDEASYGPDHPEVARDLNNLALLLKATNRLAEAERLFRRALAIDEASYGPDHPLVANRLNNLAGLLRATNRLDEAEPLYRRALAIDETSYGPDHPDVAIDLNNLAGLFQDTNRLAEAEPLYRRVVTIFETNFGPDHPNVAVSLNNLAELLRTTNRLAEAEPLYRRAVAICRASYGEDHPHTQTVARNYQLLLNELNPPEPDA